MYSVALYHLTTPGRRSEAGWNMLTYRGRQACVLGSLPAHVPCPGSARACGQNSVGSGTACTGREKPLRLRPVLQASARHPMGVAAAGGAGRGGGGTSAQQQLGGHSRRQQQQRQRGRFKRQQGAHLRAGQRQRAFGGSRRRHQHAPMAAAAAAPALAGGGGGGGRGAGGAGAAAAQAAAASQVLAGDCRRCL